MAVCGDAEAILALRFAPGRRFVFVTAKHEFREFGCGGLMSVCVSWLLAYDKRFLCKFMAWKDYQSACDAGLHRMTRAMNIWVA